MKEEPGISIFKAMAISFAVTTATTATLLGIGALLSIVLH